jgi:hypothetical protein
MAFFKKTCSLGALSLLAIALPTAAADGQHWLKIMPDDPYSKEGSFHQFDVDSAFEDEATGLVAAHMTYGKPGDATGGQVKNWYIWAFDCAAGTVYYVSNPAEVGTTANAGWHDKPNSLAEPVMGGVTNTFGKKLCALRGSWPKGHLP